MAQPASTKRPATKRAAPARGKASAKPKGGAPSIPSRLFAQVSPHSVGGLSMFEYDGAFDADIIANFSSPEDLIRRTAQALQDSGFEVLQLSPYTVNIAAPIATYEKTFKTKITAQELPTLKSGGVADTATYFTAENAPKFGLLTAQGTAFEPLVEGVAIEVPRYYFATSAYAPRKAYWHLDVPQDVSLGCNADKAHRGGITGKGIRVAMVDTGHFAHPFFSARGYRVQAVTLAPGAVNAATDDNGHGTAECANIFAVAPDAELLPVKMNFSNATGAFNAAVALNPDIITCSWGSDVRTSTLLPADQTLAIAITDAVARGIIVVFSAGNGQFGFPGQHPDVIAAGGAFLNVDGSLRASDYASGFASTVYPGRNVPDLCGLVGMKPRAAYIMLPLQAGSSIDVDLATSGTYPNGDETPGNDGWAAISGTSAAAPQLAGASALIKQACARLTPAEVRDILKRTAIDVTTGNCNTASSGAAAGAGVDLATGAGLVDANAAVLVAKVRCLGPILPIRPIRPVLPIQPVQPIRPVLPIQPVQPIRPVLPIQPIRPVQPIQPILPIQPIGPIQPADAASPSPMASTEGSGSTLSAEDIAALEDLVVRGKLDPMA